VGLALAATMSASIARAGDPAGSSDDLVKAGVAFREGRAALDAGRIEEACVSLDKSLALSRQLETLSAAARCHELLGKTATAWAERTEASVMATTAGQTDRAGVERDEASRLAARLSKLEIVAPKTVGLVVKRDGVVLTEAQLGVALAVDPGPHTITAEAQGYATRTTTVKVGADADRQTVTIPALEPAPAGSATPGDAKPGDAEPGDAKPGDAKPGDANGASHTPPNDGPPSSSDGATPPTDGLGRREGALNPLGVTAFISTSVGAVGIAMGTLFGVIVLGDVGAAEDDPSLCPNQRCTTKGRQVIDEAKTKATISTVGFAVGGVALAAGVGMFIVIAVTSDDAPPADAAPKKTTVRLAPGPGDVGAGLSVTF